MVALICYCLILVHQLSALSLGGKWDLKSLKSAQTITRGSNYHLENNDSRNSLSWCHLELCDFSINKRPHCCKCPRLLTYQDFFQNITIVTFASSCHEIIITWTDKTTPNFRYKWGKIGPTHMYLLSEYGTLPFSLHFSKTVFGTQNSEIVLKISFNRFYFWGITSRRHTVCCSTWGIIHSSTEGKYIIILLASF